MSTNKQWWEPNWSSIYDLPATARIALRYQSLEEVKNEWRDSGKYIPDFYATYCKPSQERHIKYLRNNVKEKLVTLHTAEYNTLIPGVGYKTKHYSTKEDVYVVQNARWGEPTPRNEERPQEYVQIVSKYVNDYWSVSRTHEDRFIETVLSRQSIVSRRYIDRLTRKQREALALLKIMDVDGYVEGAGYRKLYNKYMGWDNIERRAIYSPVVLYFIDAVKREEDEDE